VALDVAGGEVTIDRALLDGLAEPLGHLLRNAVDHGIEPAEERRAAGKAERGHIILRSAAEGARVRVCVEDDGRGIDLARVERAARAGGVIPAGARVREEQALRLIFRPGFSTAAGVTETSGRGVGLDAVERAVEGAGGEVRVRTRAGQGTTFELRLPLALALVPVVLVESGGETYAIDAARVVETGRMERSSITSEGTRRPAAWRGRQLPYVSLPALLGRAADDTAGDAGRGNDAVGSVTVLVVSPGRAGAQSQSERQRHGGDEPDGASGGQAAAPDKQGPAPTEPAGVSDERADTSGEQAAAAGEHAGESDEDAEGAALAVVAVDRIAGRRDALVRGLGRHATRWRGVGGAIDLRDGSAALLLDLASLVEMSEGGR
ncbi:MAG TPA: ATP-binding protein, partial [Pyrinomonadaceae bacterium]|nr:ATP-binding protein [Pyrinomonadaceae bacterium]